MFRADKCSSISVYELRSGYMLPAAAKPSETLRAKERMKLGRPLQGLSDNEGRHKAPVSGNG